MNERSGFPSMTALLGLLAIAGYQNRDKIGEMLKNMTGGAGANPGAGSASAPALPGGLGGLLAGTSVGGLLTNGLNEMMDKFNQAGHGDKVDSWVGTGPNKDVAPTDLKNALGTDVIAALARATGMSEQDLLAKLSHELPQAVDKYTPAGRIASA
jgi:uncharacterized protein YidB (DUF937 family)